VPPEDIKKLALDALKLMKASNKDPEANQELMSARKIMGAKID
jgi:hypothetical protein